MSHADFLISINRHVSRNSRHIKFMYTFAKSTCLLQIYIDRFRFWAVFVGFQWNKCSHHGCGALLFRYVIGLITKRKRRPGSLFIFKDAFNRNIVSYKYILLLQF
jgi:hypothetical protein